MTLKDFISLIKDEDVRIELELDIEEEQDYLYTSFWLSDFRGGIRFGRTHCLDYAKWTVEGVSFSPVMYDNADFSIQIKP